MTPAGGRRRRLPPRSRRVVAAILLGLVACAGGAYSVNRLTASGERAPVTGHVAVPSVPPRPATPGPAEEAGPEGIPPPRPAAVAPHQVVVPILLYHYIRVNRHPSDLVGFNLSVTPQHFAEQMALLAAEGAHTVTLADLVAALRGGPPLPPRSVVLTFDDGYDDFYGNALPVLTQDRLQAIAYVVSGFVDRPGYMTAAQVRAIAAAGMVVGAHTVHHVALAHIPPASARQEIVVCRQQLEALIGSPVDDFAYPYGDWDPAVATLVEQAGFRDAVTTDLGNVHDLSQRFTLRRIRVGGGDTLASFAAKAGVPVPPATAAPAPARSPAAATPQPSASARPSASAAATALAPADRRAA